MAGKCEVRLKELQPSDSEILISLVRNYLKCSPDLDNEATIRFRSPYLQTTKHDARGDAVALIVEHLHQKNFPPWAGYAVAYSIVDIYASELNTTEVPFDENDYSTIDATIWCREVIHYLNMYFNSLVNNSVPLPKIQSIPDQLLYSYCAQKNRRSKMEDRAVLLPSLSVIEPTKGACRDRDSFFAVFDGHNGVDCANYASSHFARCLIENTQYAVGQIENIMRNTFTELDKRLTARCKNEHIKGGTTAVCAFLRARRHLCVGWCGDSAVAVLRKGTVRTLSSAHSPDVPEEVRRVEEAGGMVVPIQGELRVNGILNLTRSLGDIDGRPMISPEPDILSFELDNSEYLLFLSCDGVWDSMSEQEVYSHVAQFVCKNSQESYGKLAEFIVDRARESGATDNLTLICVFLRPVEDLWKLFIADL
ncbi:phosphatase 1E [Loa loa]|uniref:Phosphatase 1E n=1 Tax=Loa loa TaxID=7209 RepID=A0A1I7W1M6_LOALO|nr:phosphatase 1E [Loa loa]EJD74122.1 phosphatase 1E [Loa loa]